MNRYFLRALFVLGFSTAVSSCGDSPATAPAALQTAQGRAAALKASAGKSQQSSGLPQTSQAWLVQCEQHASFEWEGDIGSSGGTIFAGPHILVIPAGALTETIHISARVPAGDNVVIEFEPSGLTFKKPAGLLLNAGGCNLDGYTAPDVAYLNDLGEPIEFIPAVYSNLWKTVAAPIWHFSGYALAW